MSDTLKELKITIQPYEYEDCGCGCGENGVTVFVNGIDVGDVMHGDRDIAIHLILEHLGYDVTIEYNDKDGEEY